LLKKQGEDSALGKGIPWEGRPGPLNLVGGIKDRRALDWKKKKAKMLSIYRDIFSAHLRERRKN